MMAVSCPFPCKAYSSKKICPHFCMLQVSKDFGVKWINVSEITRTDNYASAFWSLNPQEPDLVFFSVDSRLFFTKNYGKTDTTLFANLKAFLMTKNSLYIFEEGKHLVHIHSSNWPSPSHTEITQFTTFPFSESVCSILDDSTPIDFLLCNSNIYSFDFLKANGLKRVVEKIAFDDRLNSVPRFHPLIGLQGIFISSFFKPFREKSRISYDSGNTWSYLHAPLYDYYGKETNCSRAQRCYLHFTKPLTNFPRSTLDAQYIVNSLGVVVGTGSLGRFLSYSAPLQTYLSRDAGVSWIELFPRPTTFAIGPQSGLFVFVPFTEPTTIVYYSIDQATTFSTFNFSSQPVHVGYISTNPHGNGTIFLLHTYNTYPFVLDFSDIIAPLSTCGASDYELWTPTDQDNKPITFLDYTYTCHRRKQTACINLRKDPCFSSHPPPHPQPMLTLILAPEIDFISSFWHYTVLFAEAYVGAFLFYFCIALFVTHLHSFYIRSRRGHTT
eukprot:Phypoly_transcript_04497.p1 GENE.Phypoly_transcript_04497~~Phypoly_transcript_04497.p1  ORF type:complete len:497 (+),score=51.94 Phypoly_transcript_04497:538-2028(+)